MTGLRSLDPEGLAPGGATWSQATVAGDLVFVSGQVAWDAEGGVIGRGSIETQTEAVFDNLERALRAAGSGLDRIARMTVYLVDGDDVATFRAVRDRRLAGSRPASTLVMVDALVEPELVVEVDAIAVAALRPPAPAR